MLHYALVFLVVALIAAALGFGGIAGAAVGITGTAARKGLLVPALAAPMVGPPAVRRRDRRPVRRRTLAIHCGSAAADRHRTGAARFGNG